MPRLLIQLLSFVFLWTSFGALLTHAQPAQAAQEEKSCTNLIKKTTKKNHSKKAQTKSQSIESLQDVHIWYYGGDPEEIDMDSLLGQYLKETGASVRLMKLKLNSDKKIKTETRLVVSLSENSFPAFQKYFSNPNGMSVIGHANVLHNGDFFTYGGPKSEFRIPALHTPIPFVLLNKSEAIRLSRYMKAASTTKYAGWGHALKLPWYIHNYFGTAGAYNCCTHWIGNLPIGDNTTEKIILPGRQNKPEEVEITKPQFSAENKDLEEIWTFPLHEPLSKLLGLEKENGTGEFASPGGVVEMLFGLANFERVPIVFVVRDDHKKSIPDDIELNYEGRH